jgi:uncharacterized membrane protein YedE/YeeE
MKLLLTYFTGLLFGLGLIISGMTNPDKVIGFLDLLGTWDPSLALVMSSAIPVTFLSFRWLEKREKTVFNDELHLPGITHINIDLILGSFIFGVGWALAGYCPGPAIVALGSGKITLIYFVGAMLIGMQLVHFFHAKNKK